MSIPDYQSLMLPLLELISNGDEWRFSSVLEELAQQFQLTEAERRELLPSGRQSSFDNRVGWATTYLAKAGLLQRTGRGRFQITERGRQVLQDAPLKITARWLERFAEFQEFKGKPGQDNADNRALSEEVSRGGETLEEVLEITYQQLRRQLATELLQTVKAASPRFFEQLVVDLLVAMGYGGSRKDAGQAVGPSGDGGIDGIIKEDPLGLDAVYVQAKRWEGAVGRPVVQTFAGSLEGHRARKGVLITTSHFTPDARTYVDRIEKKIILIDGDQLTEMMIDHDVGVAEAGRYALKKIDVDYFGDI